MSEDLEIEQSTVETTQPTESEVKAKQFGWVPKEDFRGDPEQWRDADTFLRRGEEVLGFVRKDLDKANARLAQKDKELAEIRETMEEFRKFHNETEARAYKRAISDLKKQQAEAIEQGDGIRVVELTEEIENLKEAQKTPVKSNESTDNKKTVPILYSPEEFTSWATGNSWYGQDNEMSVFAEDIADGLLVKEPDLKGVAFLEKVTRKVKAHYPEKFENPNRENSPVSGTSNTRPSNGTKKKSYENLPPEAKKECDRFCKMKTKHGQALMTREQYVQEYEWDN